MGQASQNFTTANLQELTAISLKNLLIKIPFLMKNAHLRIYRKNTFRVLLIFLSSFFNVTFIISK